MQEQNAFESLSLQLELPRENTSGRDREDCKPAPPQDTPRAGINFLNRRQPKCIQDAFW